jgi:hypothetical protein
MEAKWPFFLLVLFFIGLTGWLVSYLEHAKVLRDWETRRCEFPIMVAARFFKPDTDPRTPSEFSSENFEFCTKRFTDSFLSVMMAPVTWLFAKDVNLAGGAMGALKQVREVTQRVYTAFTTYLTSYLEKYKRSMGGLRRILIYLKMAVQRMSAIALSTIYMGMTMFRGMVTSIQVVVRVILIICAIMIAILILLWFVLFPVIPIIMSTLTAVIALVMTLSVVMSGSLAADAESKKGGFCFAQGTRVRVVREEVCSTLPIEEIQVGDVLSDGGRVTARMEMTSDGVAWYSLEGIFVSGDHMVESEEGWGWVKNDKRAVPSVPPPSCSSVYCFNTTTRCIPIASRKTGKTIRFRDWEEFEESDTEGHQQWAEWVQMQLNGVPMRGTETEAEKEGPDLPLCEKDTEVLTVSGWRPIQSLSVGDRIMGRDHPQTVLGCITGMTTEKGFLPDGWIWYPTEPHWRREADIVPQNRTVRPGMGYQLITESGEFQSRYGDKVVWRRDMTEVGYQAIQESYEWVLGRLLNIGPSPVDNLSVIQ